jgi:hypothetical protein
MRENLNQGILNSGSTVVWNQMVFADVACLKCGIKIELEFMDSFLPAKDCTCTQDNGTRLPMCLNCNSKSIFHFM